MTTRLFVVFSILPVSLAVLLFVSSSLSAFARYEARGITTTNTYNYTAFVMGELRETATTGLTSTKHEYHSNGLIHKVKSPIPGEQNTGNRQTTEYSYFSNGNLWKVESPGNNAETTHLTTLYYGTAARLGRPEQVYNSSGEYHTSATTCAGT